MSTYDKSLLEVWGWKEKVEAGYKGLSLEERCAKMNSNVERYLAVKGLKLRRRASPVRGGMMLVAEEPPPYGTKIKE